MMHENSMKLMKRFIRLLPNAPLKILDVGSYDVNGTYKSLFKNSKWSYTGLDIVEGPNVDMICKTIPWPINNQEYDVVISGQCLEHTEEPWVIIKEIERVCKPNGLIAIIVPWKHEIHRYPIDCWRILPDGLRSLLKSSQVLECDVSDDDAFVFARKD